MSRWISWFGKIWKKKLSDELQTKRYRCTTAFQLETNLCSGVRCLTLRESRSITLIPMLMYRRNCFVRRISVSWQSASLSFLREWLEFPQNIQVCCYYSIWCIFVTHSFYCTYICVHRIFTDRSISTKTNRSLLTLAIDVTQPSWIIKWIFFQKCRQLFKTKWVSL